MLFALAHAHLLALHKNERLSGPAALALALILAIFIQFYSKLYSTFYLNFRSKMVLTARNTCTHSHSHED